MAQGQTEHTGTELRRQHCGVPGGGTHTHLCLSHHTTRGLPAWLHFHTRGTKKNKTEVSLHGLC